MVISNVHFDQKRPHTFLLEFPVFRSNFRVEKVLDTVFTGIGCTSSVCPKQYEYKVQLLIKSSFVPGNLLLCNFCHNNKNKEFIFNFHLMS